MINWSNETRKRDQMTTNLNWHSSGKREWSGLVSTFIAPSKKAKARRFTMDQSFFQRRTKMTSLQTSLQRIEAWLHAHAPTLLGQLPPGASEKDLRSEERR